MQMHHQRLQQQQQQYQQANYKIDESNSAYNFDILETDDTTDDENKPNPKRPPIPSWSRSMMLNNLLCKFYLFSFYFQNTSVMIK